MFESDILIIHFEELRKGRELETIREVKPYIGREKNPDEQQGRMKLYQLTS